MKEFQAIVSGNKGSFYWPSSVPLSAGPIWEKLSSKKQKVHLERKRNYVAKVLPSVCTRLGLFNKFYLGSFILFVFGASDYILG